MSPRTRHLTNRRAAAAYGVAALTLAASAIAGGCTRDDPGSLIGTGSGTGTGGHGSTSSSHSASSSSTSGTTTTSSSSTAASSSSGSGGGGTGGMGGGMPVGPDDRVLSYTDALRTASFKIVGDAPTLDQIITLRDASDQKSTYEGMIDMMLADPRFAVRMMEFWQNAFRMKGPANGSQPSRDTAPAFAARLVVEGGDITQLLTQTDPTKACPTFDPTTGKFADGMCSNAMSLTMNGQTTVGILTDPGVQALYYGNLAFRRNRFYHETFLCRNATDALAEPTSTPGTGCPVPGYGSPWPFNSITGLMDNSMAKIDFQNAVANGVICANCHATWNHRAPLWGNFDSAGNYQASFAVHTPVVGLPLATRQDWLPDAEVTSWKYNVPASSLAQLGQVMAADPEVQACTVARMWNFAMSRGDIVETSNKVSTAVTGPLVASLTSMNNNLRAVLTQIFKGDDFVKWGQPPAADTPPAGSPLPLDISSRMHGCEKVNYSALGNFLKARGVNLSNTTAGSAGALYAGAGDTFGLPATDSRTREPSFLTTAGATKMFDIFMQAASEIIANIGNPKLAPACSRNGANSAMFDSTGTSCVEDSVSCLIGRPATQNDVLICGLMLKEADQTNPADVKNKQQMAVATLLAAAHTCE